MKTKTKNPTTKKEQLEKILSDLKKVGGIINSAVVSRDGLLVASDLTKTVDADTFAAMSAAMEGAAETAVSELKQGELRQIIIDADEGKLITLSAGKKAILVVLARPDINLGLILLELGRASGKLSEVLGR
jgi:hypothetical protein